MAFDNKPNLSNEQFDQKNYNTLYLCGQNIIKSGGLIDSFREQVSQIAELKPGFTFNETQIRLDGSITDLDINFVFIVGDEGGLYLNADMLLIDNDVMTTITKLSKFELTFRDTIEPLLRERKTN